MRKVLILLLIFSACDEPAKTPAYILMGQSNASPMLAEGMRAETNMNVYQVYHPGQPIEKWFTDTKQILMVYDEQYIEDAGFYPVALFWFQGEQNCYNENEQYYFGAYTSNLFHYIKTKYNIPIHIFKIGYTGENPEVLNNIDWIRAQQDWLNSYYGGIMIDTELYERRDAWHLTDPEYIRLGKNIINEVEQ